MNHGYTAARTKPVWSSMFLPQKIRI